LEEKKMHHKYYTVPRMTLVALALSQAFASQAMAQQAPADSNTVVVTGIRASAQSSLTSASCRTRTWKRR
jgi:hypothetical protein